MAQEGRHGQFGGGLSSPNEVVSLSSAPPSCEAGPDSSEGLGLGAAFSVGTVSLFRGRGPSNCKGADRGSPVLTDILANNVGYAVREKSVLRSWGCLCCGCCEWDRRI